jgi:hypothetical protein
MPTIVEKPDGTRLEMTTVYIPVVLKAAAKEQRWNLSEILADELKRRLTL